VKGAAVAADQPKSEIVQIFGAPLLVTGPLIFKHFRGLFDRHFDPPVMIVSCDKNILIATTNSSSHKNERKRR
jgi:hypothetical protein